ncbi:unnamed protein product [Pleuronectes platessa]|uniref:DAD domain-containing protein n=1 Tax=Pleuronectes platessa TaxID=8262 RepID=A0A9N7UJF3_PLEPL|nr:unnamed protein product [Pleuronectes platessa]
MDSLLEALQSGAAFRDRRKRAPRPRENQHQTISPGSFRQVLRPVNHDFFASPHHSLADSQAGVCTYMLRGIK